MIYSPLSDLVGQTFGWKLADPRDALERRGPGLFGTPHLMCGYPILGNLNYALLFPDAPALPVACPQGPPPVGPTC